MGDVGVIAPFLKHIRFSVKVLIFWNSSIFWFESLMHLDLKS